MDLFENLVEGRDHLLHLQHEIKDYKSLTRIPHDVFSNIYEYEEIARVVLDKNRYLNKAGWYTHSVKSHNDIKGKRAELCYVALANNASKNGTTYHFNPNTKNKYTEIQGIDCICKNPRWNWDYYTIQVKYAVIDDIITFRVRFFKYDPSKISRLVLADPTKRIAIEMNYYQIARFLDVDIAIPNSDEEGRRQIHVPYERLKQKEKALHLHRYEYKW